MEKRRNVLNNGTKYAIGDLLKSNYSVANVMSQLQCLLIGRGLKLCDYSLFCRFEMISLNSKFGGMHVCHR